MWPSLTTWHWLTLHGLVTVLALFTYVLTSHALQQRRHPSAAIGWVLFILLLPYAALPLYLLFGNRKVARVPFMPLAEPALSDAANRWPQRIAAALRQPAPVAYSDLCIHADGTDALHRLLKVIDGAQHTLDVCTFIIGRDRLGASVSEHLAASARAGIRVRLLVDGIGRMLSGWPDFSALQRAGVQVSIFVEPLESPLKGRINMRNHRKLVVADAGATGERMWCGGRNLATEYFEGFPDRAAWRDLSFDLAGAVARQASAQFERDWRFSGAVGVSGGHVETLPVNDTIVESSSPIAQIIASGPDQADDTIYSLLLAGVYRADKRVAIASPYVVPDESLLTALCMAARRGVRVDLLLPSRSNHRLADIARHRSLRRLTAAGAHVWLAPQMLHAKAMIVDDALALAGSANLDSRSLFLNYELMTAFHTAEDVMRFVAWFDRERGTATRYCARRPGLLRDLAEGLLLWIGFQL